MSRAGSVETRACRWCEKTFSFVVRARGRRPQLCSDECRRLDHNRTQALTVAAKRAREQRRALLRAL